MPDVKHVGGLGPLLQVAAALSSTDVEISPHNPSGLVATLAGGRLGDYFFSKGDGGYFKISGIGLLIGAPFVLITPLLGNPWVTLGVALVAEFFLFLKQQKCHANDFGYRVVISGFYFLLNEFFEFGSE